MSPVARRLHVAMLLRNPYTHDSRVEKEAATLRDAGYRVTIVADAGVGLPEREEREGACVIRVPRRLGQLPGVRYALHDRRLVHVLVSLRPDILHAHDSNALLPVGLAARRLDRPFVYDAHELWLHRPRRGHARVYHEASRAYYAAMQRWLVPRAAAIITVSEPIVRHLERVYRRSDVALVPNYPVLRERPTPAALRELVGSSLPPDAPIVLHLGGIMASRGLEQLVSALPFVPEAHLVLLGGGEASSLHAIAARAGAGGRLHVVPPVAPALVEEHAAAADVGVVTTQPIGLNNRYSLPNKLFQYMAAGIPVIATDFPQITDIVVGSGAGLVTDTRSPELIARALSTLLADLDAARAMGDRGRAAVEARYNWTTSAEALIDAYERAGPRPRGA
jgi:glycosyltransferase involved in cell wall biosynthesis